MFLNKMIADQGQCGTHNHSNMCFLQWYNALNNSQRSLWEVELRHDPKETTKRTSAYWLDINSLRRSNGGLARMDRNRKYTCFQYLKTIQIKPLQAILENNILWTKKHTNKQSSKGRLHDHGSYNEMKAFFDCLLASNCIGLYITITLLTSPSKHLDENGRTFQSSLVRLKIFQQNLVFRDFLCEASQDLAIRLTGTSEVTLIAFGSR